jgi:nucleoid DNA-binding protein
MNKRDLARRLARESHRSNGQAADAVDTLVYKILKDLKRPVGKPAARSSKAPTGRPPKDPT